jgi:cobalamin-dependent methionine synthase I
MMDPEASVSALVFHHQEAEYLTLTKPTEQL